MEVNILPISKHFDLRDLCFFHKIVNCHVPTTLTNYIIKNRGSSNPRLRSNHLDRDSYICNLLLELIGKCNFTSPISKNFFYRTTSTLLWNQLPQDIRTIPIVNVFKTQVTQFLWLNASKNIEYYQTKGMSTHLCFITFMPLTF